MAVSKTCVARGGWFKKLLRGMICASIAISTASSSPSFAQENLSQWTMTNTHVSIDTSQERQMMQMVVNTSRELTADQVFKRVRIQNPNVLTAVPLEGGNRLQISAIATGITQVDLLGADDSVHTIEVMVLGDVRELEAILRQQFPDANLQVVPVQTGCIVSGFVTSDEHVNQVVQIAELYFPTIINKVNVTGIHTIQLETQIMEVSRTKLRELGVDWAFGSGDDVISQSVSGLVNAAGTTFSATGNETFKFGIVNNNNEFFSAVRALRRNNLVKVLASPTLTAVDGRPASFNAGGEIPIIVPAGLGQVAVQFREFGTRLDYVAKVRGGGKIWLEVRPYVSEIDPSRSVSINGLSVPGLRSRYLETGVELGAGQTLALAGLLQVKSETINQGLPVLSDMPYLGALFRTTREEQNEIELLITVTPNFAGPMDPHEVPAGAPGMGTQSPTDKELYWRGYLETPVGDYCDPNLAQNGLIEGGYQMGIPGNAIPTQSVTPGYGGNFAPGSGGGYGPTNYGQPASLSVPPSSTVPNPAAMSVGPNAPKLAQQPGLLPPPSNFDSSQYNNGRYPAGQQSQGSVVR